MAKVSFTDELNIRPARQNFPKIAKLKKGEKIRIQFVDSEDITMEYVHNLEAPVIENGAGVQLENGKWKMRYMGSPLSFGDLSILADSGLDTKNCPMSAFAKKHPEMLQAPKRKFAAHVIQYRTKAGSFNVQKPYSVEHKVWVFTEKTMAKLQELRKEWGDFRKHDLYITCENEIFQQYDISVAPSAVWLDGVKEDRTNYNLTMETYNAGKEEFNDLSLAIGQRKEKKWVEDDLAAIEEAWGVVTGASSQASLATLDDADFDDILSTDKQASPAATAEAVAPVTEDSILAQLADEGDTDSSAESFDDLLGDLGIDL